MEMEIISGSGVFAQDPDRLITFTKDDEEGPLWWRWVLRNLPSGMPVRSGSLGIR